MFKNAKIMVKSNLTINKTNYTITLISEVENNENIEIKFKNFSVTV